MKRPRTYKLATCRRAVAIMDDGTTLITAAEALGMPKGTLSKWLKEYTARGEEDAFTGRQRTGRPQAVTFTEDDLAIARWHRITKTSLDIAIAQFCADPRTSDDAVAALNTIYDRALAAEKRPAWPISVRRAFEVTAEEADSFRGGKRKHDNEMVTARSLTWIDDAGNIHDLMPGELWELDDYSTNQPYVWKDPATGALEVGRQVLGALDLVSYCELGFDFIGRERDAYRGEDIVRYIGRLFRAHGVPRFLRLERGSWESSYVHGLTVDGVVEGWGSLDELTHIVHVWKSKAKGSREGAFNTLQNWLAHTGRDVGRYRGEFAEAQKAWARAKKEARLRPDPVALGFVTQEQAAALHEDASRVLNGRPKDRKALNRRIAPDDLRNEMGWHTTPMPESEAWRLLPYKKDVTVTGGMVSVRPGNGWAPMSFVVNGVSSEIHLDNGHKVLVAYDPANPAAGAYIANADKSAKNRESWGIGQVIHTAAPFYESAPQINLSGVRHGSISTRKAASSSAATSFRAITAAGQRPQREAAAMDGAGRSATSGTMPPAHQGETAPGEPQIRHRAATSNDDDEVTPRRAITPEKARAAIEALDEF